MLVRRVLCALVTAAALAVLLPSAAAGAGYFDFQSPQPFDFAPLYATALAAADFNNDGRPDIAVGLEDANLNGSVSILRNTSSGGSLSLVAQPAGVVRSIPAG